MSRCAGTKGNGERCRGIAATGSDYCPAHDPNRQEARHRAASKAAKSKRGKGVLDELYEQTRKLYEELERGEIDPKVGAVLVQTVNTQTRIVELHRRIEFSDVVSREQLDEEIRALHEIITQNVNDRETMEAITRGYELRLERSFLEEGD
jgi:DNA replicative helicase MCM subunit Mcm2 (Cdc46/Mcm family)